MPVTPDPPILLRFGLCCLALLLLSLGFGWQLAHGLHFQTDILALLPATARDSSSEQARQAFTERGARRLSFAVGARDPAQARAGAAQFAASLRASKAFAEVQLELDANLARSANELAPYRLGLLSDTHRAWLEQDQATRLRDEALRALYSPSSLARPLPVADDLLGLGSAFLLQQSAGLGRAQPDGGMLVLREEDFTWVLLFGQTTGRPLAADTQQQVSAALAAAELTLRDAAPEARLLRSGVVLHALAAAQRARTELSVFGAISGLAVVLLVWLTFRSLRPLALTLIALGFGAAAGVLACQWAFGSVHLITLVFGTSLIGVAVDYSLHFFSDQFRDPAGWTPTAGLAHVGPSIFLGHVATLLGYAGLLLAPLPGVRQMALFSIIGLMVACACVLCLYPRLARRSAAREPLALRLAQRLAAARWRFRARAAHLLAAFALIVFALGGIARLSVQDDIRVMQSSPPQLIAQENELRELLGTQLDSRFFLVRGATAEQVLQREETLRAALEPLRADGRLGEILAVSRALPSQQRQAENRRLQLEHVLAPQGVLPQVMRQLGADQARIDDARTRDDRQGALLTPEVWLGRAGSQALRAFWIGQVGAEYASAVGLADVRDSLSLHAVAQHIEGVEFVDHLNEVSAVLREYRQTASLLMAAAYAAILLLLALRYGLAGALLTLLPPVAATALVLGLLGWLGQSLSVFNVLALLLVLGMGVDYAIFLREGRRTQITVLLAILLSALTTLLSFGLLALSATPFIRAIGLTLAPGIALIFLLAVWLGPAAAEDTAA